MGYKLADLTQQPEQASLKTTSATERIRPRTSVRCMWSRTPYGCMCIMKNNGVYAQQERELPCSSLSCAGFLQTKSPPDLTIQRVLLAERWGFEPQNAFDTLHDFQSCALDQLSHLSTSFVLASGPCPSALHYNTANPGFCQAFFETFLCFFKSDAGALFFFAKRMEGLDGMYG